MRIKKYLIVRHNNSDKGYCDIMWKYYHSENKIEYIKWGSIKKDKLEEFLVNIKDSDDFNKIILEVD